MHPVAVPKEKRLPDEQELRRRVAEQVGNARGMIKLARKIRREAIEMRVNNRRKAS
jgi:hypothetical protein